MYEHQYLVDDEYVQIQDKFTGLPDIVTRRHFNRRTAVITLNAAATGVKNKLIGVTDDGTYLDYDPGSITAVTKPIGHLVDTVVVDGVNNKQGRVFIGGIFDVSEIIGLDQAAVDVLLQRGYTLEGARITGGVKIKGSNYVITANDHGCLFVANAAVSFTLPTKENGLWFDFLQSVNADMTVSTGNSDIVVKNNANATSVAFSTSNQKIGSKCRLKCVYVDINTLAWVFDNFGGTTVTVT